MVRVRELPREESVLEKLVHNPGCVVEAVLHEVQRVGLLPVILHQGVDAVPVGPEVEGRALVQELLELGRRSREQLAEAR